jgi:hypothetical protein
MWLSLFSVVTAAALAFGLAAVVLESYEERPARTMRQRH